MDSEEAAAQFVQRFEEIYRRFYRRVRPTAFRPSPEVLAVLRHLRTVGPLTVSEAGRHFSRSQASTSELVSRLEARGLVARVQDERDRRRSLIWLTDEGLELVVDTETVLSTKRLAAALDQIGPAERAALLSEMERLLSTDPQPEGWEDE